MQPYVTCSEIRTGIASAVSAQSGWTESRLNPALFPSDTQNMVHHSFVVEVVKTDPMSDRQRLTEGTNVISTVAIQWAHRVRADAQVNDYGSALDSEQELIEALMGHPPERTHIVLGGLTRRWTDEGTWFVGRVEVRILHLLGLR